MTERIAVVLGASGLVGRAIATRLADDGYVVVAVGRDPVRLDLTASLRGHDLIIPVTADLLRAGERAALCHHLTRRGRLDAIVFASGIYSRSHEPGMLRSQLEANVEGPYALLREVRPLLVETEGQVVFLNSTQGLTASAGIGQYAATQHALRAIADSFRAEVNEEGVRVASIFLGRTASERQQWIFGLEGRTYRPERLIQPGDVAAIVAALLQLPRTAEVTDLTLRPMLKV